MSALLGVLGMGRARATARMTETGRLYRVVSEEVDPVTLAAVETTVDVLTDQKARVKYPLTTLVRDETLGTQLVGKQALEVHFPSGTAGVETDLFFIVEESTADPVLVGRKFRLKGAGAAGQTTALRVPAEEVS